MIQTTTLLLVIIYVVNLRKCVLLLGERKEHSFPTPLGQPTTLALRRFGTDCQFDPYNGSHLENHTYY
jgi:hypothetical protein